MSGALSAKDMAVMTRRPVLRALLAAVLVLLLVSLVSGIHREHVFAAERTAAMQTDDDVWLLQGDRNPHSAAHFSRYAFRPSMPLAMLDPGVSDYAGLAVWMEAHYRNPADFRRAEDASELSRFVQLSPSFLLLIAAPLLVIVLLHGSVAAEREDGTLRQLIASGITTREFFAGKMLAGMKLTLRTYSVVFAFLAVISLITTAASTDPDTLLRLGLMYVLYGAYLTIFVALATGTSALFGSRRTAFLSLTAIWLFVTLLVPRIGTSVATALHPQPDARAVAGELRLASGMWWDDKDRQARGQAALRQQYGVDDLTDLPFNYEAYALQLSEELSNPQFDRVYRELERTYDAQESVLQYLSLLSPAISAAALSRGLAGTDRPHHAAFTAAAEQHRRAMVKMLNEDFMRNAGDAGYDYTAGRELWARFEALDHQPPSLGAVSGRYAVHAVVLIAWLVASLVLAQVLVRRAVARAAVA